MFQFKKKEKDVEYDIDFPPTGIDFDSWDKRTADRYFKWFAEQIPIRTEYLRTRVARDMNIEISALDFSPKSLITVWDWYMKTAIIEKTPKETLEKTRQSQAYRLFGESYVNKEQLSLNSLMIQRDIGMYLAQVFLKESPKLEWTYEHDPPRKKVKNIFNNRPSLTGFTGEEHPHTFEPIHMVGVQGVGVLNGDASKTDLYDLYKQYSKWLPKIQSDISAASHSEVNKE